MHTTVIIIIHERPNLWFRHHTNYHVNHLSFEAYEIMSPSHKRFKKALGQIADINDKMRLDAFCKILIITRSFPR